MREIYDSYNPATLRATQVDIDHEAGVVFTHAQDVKPIVESCKALASNFDPHARRPDGFVHVARIPLVVWQQLQRQGITRDEKAFNQWLDGRDQRVFRVDDGRKI